MRIQEAPKFQPPVRLQGNKQPDQPKPASSDKYEPSRLMEGVKRKAGAMSSVIAGTAIGAGITALATGALSTGLVLATPAILLAGAAGVGIGLYRSRNESGNFASVGKMISGGMHGIGGLTGGLIGKATVMGLAAGGTGMGLAAGVSATAVAGLALAYGTVKFVEMFRWRG